MALSSQTAELVCLVLASAHLQMLGVQDAVKQEMPAVQRSRSFSALLLLPPLRLPQLLQQRRLQQRQLSHWGILEP
jgi:hypothetical protein